MNRPRLFKLMLLLVLLSHACAHAAETTGAATTTAPSTTAATSPEVRQAARVLHVKDADAMTDEILAALNAQARHVGGARLAALAERNLAEWFTAHEANGGASLLVRLEPSDPPVAGEIVDALVDWYREHLRVVRANWAAGQLRALEREADTARGRADQAAAEAKAFRDEVRGLSGRADVSPDTLRNSLASMDQMLQKLDLELMSRAARRDAIEREIAQTSARVQKQVETDEIAAELKKVVDAREEQIKRLRQMHENGTASSTELTEAIANAAEARAKWLQQQRDAAAATGGAALEGFNRQLMELTIDAKEMEAQAAYVKERLPKLRDAVDQIPRLRHVEREAELARETAVQAAGEVRKVRQSIEQTPPPRVLVKESINTP